MVIFDVKLDRSIRWLTSNMVHWLTCQQICCVVFRGEFYKKIYFLDWTVPLMFGIQRSWFLAHLAKGNVNFCRHIVSVVRHLLYVVCRPLTFHILIFSSETPQPNKVKFGRNHLWKDLSKDCSFCTDPLTNMATIDHSCFWLADI